MGWAGSGASCSVCVSVEGKEPAGEGGWSPLSLLAGETGLLRMKVVACRPEGGAGEVEGSVRLLGGNMLFIEFRAVWE